ncbi:hydrogenase 2 maturation endopeptidase [Geomonas limicola]|uniref:Hydrogenase 2 maturation endopeptidase n=1 Tax=Geomonas limicola TaxID=2740186 RepID=A0A6V8NIU9_9BACT|nr:hydrogenase maturation protease [Geomonas limicola]GFO70829.1 hydrogenase 2 maturation endopeptidase [Geomonas limicola]
MNILVLGVGNLLMQDEGVGGRAIEELEKRFRIPPAVELLDGGTAGLELLNQLGCRDALIIVDAVQSGKAPGTVIRFEGDQVPAVFRRKISPHQLGISDLLAAARLIDLLPKRLVLFGVQPAELGTGLELSSKVAGVLGELTLLIALELQSLGVELLLKNAPHPPALTLSGKKWPLVQLNPCQVVLS